jgi:hypothetical protein
MSHSYSRVEAKRAFVLNDYLKAGPFDNIELFLIVLASEKSRLQQLTETELDCIIARDRHRLENYNRATWALERVKLGTCLVYPRMGQRAWAQGTVSDVVEKFKKFEPLTSRIWVMKQFRSVFEVHLPILVLRENAKFQIDDGSHRAIAMALGGVEYAMSWIGTL